MNTTDALQWLAQHQPLPTDDSITEQELDKYNSIRIHFINNPDVKCIPLFLNSFGGRNGFGVYQLVDDVLAMYTAEEVLPHLRQGLSSAHTHVRQWTAQMASGFPDASLIKPLALLLADSDDDVKSMAIIALRQIEDELSATILELYAQNEPDADLRDLAIGD